MRIKVMNIKEKLCPIMGKTFLGAVVENADMALTVDHMQ